MQTAIPTLFVRGDAARRLLILVSDPFADRARRQLEWKRRT
jgi:hypothetical protein